MRGGWLALVASLLLAGAPSAATAQSDPAAIASQAGLRFPEHLCGLARRAFGPHPQGVGLLASYASDNAWMDVFIVAAQRPLADDFDASVRATHQVTPGLSEIGGFAPPPGVTGGMGRVMSGRPQGQPLLTGVLMWRHSGWRIKILASAHSIQSGPEWAEVECAIRALGSAAATF